MPRPKAALDRLSPKHQGQGVHGPVGRRFTRRKNHASYPAARALVAATMTATLAAAAQRPLMAQRPTPAEEDVPDHLTAPPAQYNPAAAQAVADIQARAAEDAVAPSAHAAGRASGGNGTPLFANYYVGPPGVPAQLYPMPRPTPAFVGQVWITYPRVHAPRVLVPPRQYYRYTPGKALQLGLGALQLGIMGFIPSF